MRILFYYLAIFFLLFTYTKSDLIDMHDDEKMLKKTKVLACIALSKARMSQDQEGVSVLVENVNLHFGIKDGRNKVLSLSLVNCFSTITQEKAFEVSYIYIKVFR
jgi:hypothetical protein